MVEVAEVATRETVAGDLEGVARAITAVATTVMMAVAMEAATAMAIAAATNPLAR